MKRHHLLLAGSAMILATPAVAQSVPATQPANDVATATGDGSADFGEIVVTAQKRQQALSDVPIAVAVSSGEVLAQRGILDTSDLGKVVSGFVYTPGTFGQPVYILRGIGLFDSGLGTAPTVSVYVDQVSLPFSIMTRAAGLDVERVETLKGPQGTLFGANNTGGAINYVAAKPTDDFQAGGAASYERFSKATLRGYVSGPLSDTLKARIAVQSVTGGAWQKSLTRKDELGDSRQIVGRLLLDWEPSDRLRVNVNLNGFRDRSDTQASQIIAFSPTYPAVADPGFLASPLARANARSADWNPLQSLRKDDDFYQASVRGDYEIADDLTLTSVSAYSHMKTHWYVDLDGTAVANSEFEPLGTLKDFNQELRLQGTGEELVWLVGASYQHSDIFDQYINHLDESSLSTLGGALPVPFTTPVSTLSHKVNNYAVFANVEHKISPDLTIQAGARYTTSKRTASSCSNDRTPGFPLTAYFSAITTSLGNPALPPGGCHNLNNLSTLQGGAFNQSLKEDNISFRASIDYKLPNNGLVYASFSRGYKGGVITNVGASFNSQYLPAKQERLDAFEVGIKTPLVDRMIYLNLAAFYYDYTDKQTRARILDPNFGLLERLVNVPKARIMGLEGDITLRLFPGLQVTANGTYLESKITSDFSAFNGAPIFNQAGQAGNIKGSRLSYAPKFTGNFDAEYSWTIGEFRAALGGSVSYHSRDNSSFKVQGLPSPALYELRPYALVDLRARLSKADDRWSVEFFGRNIFNKYYVTSVFTSLDESHRYSGMPASYGVTVGFKL